MPRSRKWKKCEDVLVVVSRAHRKKAAARGEVKASNRLAADAVKQKVVRAAPKEAPIQRQPFDSRKEKVSRTERR